MCGALISELSQKKRDWLYMMMARLLELTTRFGRSAALKGAQKAALPDANLSDLTLAGARYVQEHLGDDLTLGRVARLLAVSPEHPTRTFRRDFRVSFYRYVLLLRMEEAKRLLWGPVEVPIAEVAAAVGFRSLPHFSRTFQRLTGQTSSSFRRHKTWP